MTFPIPTSPTNLASGSGLPQAVLPASAGGAGGAGGGGGPQGAAFSYVNKVIGLFGANTVAYWPQWDPSGSVSMELTHGLNGAYTNVTLAQTGIGDGYSGASFNGTTSFNNIYSAALNAAFSNQQCTISLWAKVSAAGVWTDATVRNLIQIAADANNYFQIARTATNNQLNIAYNAGSTVKAVTDASLAGTLNYFQVGMTVDKAGDALKAYINGAQVGATQSALGVWAGALATTLCCIGAASTTPTFEWSGLIAHVVVAKVAATAGQMALLALNP